MENSMKNCHVFSWDLNGLNHQWAMGQKPWSPLGDDCLLCCLPIWWELRMHTHVQYVYYIYYIYICIHMHSKNSGIQWWLNGDCPGRIQKNGLYSPASSSSPFPDCWSHRDTDGERESPTPCCCVVARTKHRSLAQKTSTAIVCLVSRSSCD